MTGASTPEHGQTIGVAIAIPEPFGSELQEWRRSFGDPLADAIPPHITLLPPTEVEPDGMEELLDHLQDVASHYPPFRVHLRGTATFRPVSPVVFIALSQGISGCERLSSAVRTGPIPVELSFPYHPHVTVAHRVSEENMNKAFDTLADYNAGFDVTSFSLYEHGDDEHWRPRYTFSLTGHPESFTK